ncbi:kinase-like domain-containing protein [Cercophora scortea]|uniref:non-specific serine/threonine protein kinase n=1 Tax=Cercophora scortea TaxID=314031 RepID=A0AAE0IVF6_9PEZI|nr:kinase-like domain-containing protein [Cercophora scortea]
MCGSFPTSNLKRLSTTTTTSPQMAVSRTALRRFSPRCASFSLPAPSYSRHHITKTPKWPLLSSLSATVGFSTARPRSLPQSQPHSFASSGYNSIDRDQSVEEETMPEYNPNHFYPVSLGEIFDGRFQTVAKLGYGSSSTIWLARDLEDHRYVALKIYIHNSARHRELPFYVRLGEVLPSNHIGAANIRHLQDSFEIIGPHGKHRALVLQVSQMSLRDMDTVFMKGRGFDEGFVKSAIKELLQAVDFLHTEVQAVHTDIHPGNLLLGLNNNSLFKALEENEHANPVPRKVLPDRTIYLSRLMKPKVGPLLLSDFGEARLGPGPHIGDIMPIMYRAPEILLHIPWSYPVDIWGVGLTTWDLLQGKTLFTARKEDGSFSDGVHLAELIGALGPPPADLLARSGERALEYWDEDGAWGNFVPIPAQQTLDAAESKLQNKTKFLQFMQRTLAWDPAKRLTAKELLEDPWLLK